MPTLVLVVWAFAILVAVLRRKFGRAATPEEEQAALTATMSLPPQDVPPPDYPATA